MKSISSRFLQCVQAVERKKKIRRQDFAKAIGISPANFTRVLKNVSLAVVYKSCKKYGLSANYIVLGEGEMFL